MSVKKNDLFMGLYLLAAVIFFIISIPSWLLDIMLAINIGIALIILFNTLYAKEVLDMAAYPTMLLFTTLFRKEQHGRICRHIRPCCSLRHCFVFR